MTPGAAGSVREELKDLRREQILEEARRLFGDRGTTDLAMDEVALAAGVARSTLYVYFPSRSELLAACIEGLYEQVVDSLTHIDEGSPRERLERLVASLLAAIDAQPAFFRLALATQGGTGEAGAVVADQLARIGLEVAALLVAIIDAARVRGEWVGQPAERAVALIGQLLYGALAVRAAELEPLLAELAAAELTDFIVAGLAGVGGPDF